MIFVVEDVIGMGYLDNHNLFRGIIFAKEFETEQDAWEELRTNKYIKSSRYSVKPIIKIE